MSMNRDETMLAIETTDRYRISHSTIPTPTPIMQTGDMILDIKPLQAVSSAFTTPSDNTITITSSDYEQYVTVSDTILTVILPNHMEHAYPAYIMERFTPKQFTTISMIDTHTLTTMLQSISEDPQVAELTLTFNSDHIHLYADINHDLTIPAVTNGDIINRTIILDPHWLYDMVKAFDTLNQPTIQMSISLNHRDPILITSPTNSQHQALICPIWHNN